MQQSKVSVKYSEENSVFGRVSYYLLLEFLWEGVGWGGRLLTFSAFRMGAYSRWVLIRGWVPNRINTVLKFILGSLAWGNKTKEVYYSWSSPTRPPWRHKKVAVEETFKQESVYGLFAKKGGRCRAMAVVERWTLLEVWLFSFLSLKIISFVLFHKPQSQVWISISRNWSIKCIPRGCNPILASARSRLWGKGGARSDLKIREGQVPRAPPLDPPLLAVPLICLFLIGQMARGNTNTLASSKKTYSVKENQRIN